MTYNFDEIIDRKNSNSVKWAFATEYGMSEDLLPLWIADMDFKAPQEILSALTDANDHGIFGYADVKETYFNTLYNWYNSRFDWQIDASWLVKTPGVVFALSTAVRSFTKKGDAILIQRPVYAPFTHCIEVNDRKVINNALVYADGRYTIDFEDFEQKIITHQVKMFFLCSPHNPVGRVWTKEELTRIGDICVTHKVIVVADEIHADFICPGHQHIVFAKIKPEFADISITCTAPSKTFNMAGLQISNIFIPNKNLCRLFKKEMDCCGYKGVGLIGLVACQAAYTHGADWLSELKDYLNQNQIFVRNFLEAHLPQIKLVEAEGTYLLWLDFNALELSEEALEDLIVHKARLWLNAGADFGVEGKGFQRINSACPRALLEKALTQLKTAVDTLG